MTTPTPERLRNAGSYLVSLATGILAGAVFALLHTPIPEPPLIGLAGLLGIAFGEIGMNRALALIRGRTSRAAPDEPAAQPTEDDGRRT